jgi:NhaP-type Na+/H+ and K+/H+ antiporter
VEEQAPRLVIVGGAGLALAGLIVAALTDGPFLSADGVNAGVLLFGIGLFAALFATPFALERRLRAGEPDRDRRWERALVRWGLVAGAVVAVGAVLGMAFGLHGSELGGSIAIVVLVDGILIAGTLVAWMFSN